MNDRFTQRVRKVLFLARDEAGRLQHDYIGTEHLLLGVIREGEGVAANVLRRLNVDFDRLQKAIEDSVTAPMGPVSIGEIPFTPRAKKVLELSIDEARLHNHNYVGTEHLLLALIREGEGVAARVLQEFGADYEKVKREVMKALGGGVEGEVRDPARKRKQARKKEGGVLEQFGRNMTDMAREGKLDPTIGRSREIDRCIQILSRRKKNNPVLIGEPGVGKTAIVEGFATRIVEGNVPALLRDREIVTLDLASVVAGTKYRGQFEERLKQIMAEIRENPDVILFIDELHTIVGAGGAEGAIDASNMLKPALSRGEIQCVGATTMDEYRKFIEKDGALERRFQPVMVNPPSEEETVEILFGLKDKYEAHHKVGLRRGRRARRGLPLQPLHLRPGAAGQGHRHHRRGRQPRAPEHGRRAAGPARDREAHRGDHRREGVLDPGPGVREGGRLPRRGEGAEEAPAGAEAELVRRHGRGAGHRSTSA